MATSHNFTRGTRVRVVRPDGNVFVGDEGWVMYDGPMATVDTVVVAFDKHGSQPARTTAVHIDTLFLVEPSAYAHAWGYRRDE